MRRTLAGLALLAGVAWAALGAATLLRRAAPVPPAPGEARGAWHVHTTRSDGRGTLDQVVAAARAAGLQFVVVTDHDRLTPAEQGYRDGVLVVEGLEASTRLGHVVVLGLSRPLTVEERSADPLATVEALGGQAVVAHPLHPLRPFGGLGRRMPWRGMEVFSNDTAWHRALADVALGRLLKFALELPWDGGRAVLDLAGTPAPELARFDAERVLDAGRVLLCSVDAHGYPSYRDAFAAVSMHLPVALTGDGAADARAVTAALLDGAAVCVLDARGGVARARLEPAPAAALVLELPAPAADVTARLVGVGGAGAERPLPLRAGQNRVPLRTLCGDTCAPGDYRIELRRGGGPWIFTNPARIG